MDLEAARKSLSPKQVGFSSKKLAFLGVAGLVLVAGIVWRGSDYFGETPAEEKAPVAVEAPALEPAAPPTTEATKSPAGTLPAAETAETPPTTQDTATAPNAPAEQTGDALAQPEPEGNAVKQAEQPELPGAGMILVARKPVEMLASPSADAPAMYGFPAGRPFRVIGREGGFAKIQDLKSGASGWIDEAALTAPPPRQPAVAAPSPSKSGAGGPKSSTASANPKAKATAKKEI
jgi:hypothetical protein